MILLAIFLASFCRLGGFRLGDTSLSKRALLTLLLALCFSSLSFAIPLAGTTIQAQAFATFRDGSTTNSGTSYSNTTIAIIQPVELLSLSTDNQLQRPALSTAAFPHVLTNTGNITSTYQFTVDRTGCAATSAYFNSMSLYIDSNGNGVAESFERTLALGNAAVLTLAPGEFVHLLLLGSVPLLADDSEVCTRLFVRADTQPSSTANGARKDTVTVSSNAAVSLSKAANYSGELLAGSSTITYAVTAQNIGNERASASANASDGLVLQPIVVDGVPQSLMLIRDVLPAGLEYVPGTLKTLVFGAKRLFRYAGEAAFSYHSANEPVGGVLDGNERADAIEVAIGFPSGLPSNATVSLNFQAKVKTNAPHIISNQASAHFFDGSRDSSSLSNQALVITNKAVLGLAKASLGSFANVDGGGAADGTATVRFQLLVRNYGSVPLYNVNISDVLENAPEGLKGYSTEVAPTGPGQYTVVANSLRVVAQDGGGTPGVLATDFTGQLNHSQLFATGGSLPPGASYTLQFDVRYNLSGLPDTVFNSATASAGLSPGSTDGVSAQSVNGTNPDVAGDGNPSAHASPTPYSTRLPVLNLVKTMDAPRRVAGLDRVYDIDVSLRVSNVGTGDAEVIRLMDSLTCAFPIGATFEEWHIEVPPRSLNNLLLPSSSYTGREPSCNSSAIASTDALASFPTLTSLSVLDGTRGLRVGESDTLKFTVRYKVAAAAIGSVITITNKAWAGVVQQIAGIPTLTWATSTTVSQSAADPSGVVYNAVTRQPVAGATVTMTRLTCPSPVTPITAAELFGDTSIYTFNAAERSVSMVTDASGTYAFVLKVPPVNDLCTYGLRVTPPASSGLVYPSALIPPEDGTFSTCGAVTGVTSAPQSTDSTTYFLKVLAGKNAGLTSVCEVTNNHIPLDPFAGNVLTLEKTSSSKTAEVGDLLTFTLKVVNVSKEALPQVSVKDQLPTGFRYVPGSSRVAGIPSDDPTGGIGPTLIFNLPLSVGAPLQSGQSITLTYQVRIGAGTPIGVDSVNRAWATSGTGASTISSNEANARVRVLGGVFADEAYAFGKVFMDCNKNGIQDDAELGIPGVRLFLEDGTGVVTDLEGKWSLYGLRPVTHALRLDAGTLPAGAEPMLMEPRQSGQADSLFLDLKKGEWHRANFAVQNCEDKSILKAVQERRAAVVENPGSEGEAVRANSRLPTEAKLGPTSEVRGLPSAGSIDATGAMKPVTTISSPLIDLPGSVTRSDFGPLAASSNATTPGSSSSSSASLAAAQVLAPQGANALEAEAVPLEDALKGLDPSLAFLNLADRAVLTQAISHVRVKGRAGSRLVLSVNGTVVPEDRVGKRALLNSQQLEAWEYIAVQFRPGVNTVQLTEVDGLGITRGSQQIQVSAPGALAEIVIEVPETAKADTSTPVRARIRLLDANGLPVHERTALTLESIGARWGVTDVNPLEPGVQVMAYGGGGTFELIAPANPGDGKVRVSSGTVQSEARIIFLPDLRPLTGIGVLEGVLHFRNSGPLPFGAPSAADAFESELREWSGQSGNEKAAARAAFYFKGAVKGEFLLTAAYDSDKTAATTMFRDIQPDQYYPIYGDSATKTFDAQSSQRLYVRIDKNRSFLLFGDFNTATSPEVRKLSQVSRTNTGLQHVYNSGDLRVSSHYSRDALKQVIEEIPANGTSGPFILSNSGNADLFSNSETVEVIVRDRNQPNVILSASPLVRFVDYSIESVSKRLLLTKPVSFLDSNLNPQSIRISYVVDTGGPAFDVAGVDMQLRMSDRMQLGVVAELDDTPDNPRKMVAATALTQLDDKTVLKGEIVATHSDRKGDGQALGLELRRDDALLKYNLTVQSSDAGFDNPSAGMVSGQTEVRGHLDYKLSEDSHLKAELLYTQDNGLASSQGTTNSVRTQGVGVSIQNKVAPNVTTEVGVRAGQTDTSAATGFDYGSVSLGTAATTAPVANSEAAQDTLAVRARVTVTLPEAANAQVFAEAEQDVNDSSRHIVAVGGNYALTEKARVYGRYEVISSLGSEYALSSGVQRNVGLIGVESAYMQGGRIYDEYRIADTIDGRSLQSAMGVRNTFEVTEGLKLTGSLEHVSAMPGATGASSGAATALTSGFDWLGVGEYRGRVRGSGFFEMREASDATSTLLGFGFAYKLNTDWSLLTRATVNNVNSRSNGSARWLEREQIGFAYRPVAQDVWNSLLRYEHKADTWSGAASSSLIPVNSVTDIVSAHLNYQPRKSDVFSARVAAKHTLSTSDGLRSTYGAQLLYARWTHDINQDWDFGVQAGLLLGDGGTQQHALGAELGYQLSQGLWLSGGYNLLGLHDPDLSGADYTDAGLYLRLRLKFDERSFSGNAFGEQ